MQIPTYILWDDRCVMCGEPVPEGRMVCGLCEINVLADGSAKHDLPSRKRRKNFSQISVKSHH